MTREWIHLSRLPESLFQERFISSERIDHTIEWSAEPSSQVEAGAGKPTWPKSEWSMDNLLWIIPRYHHNPICAGIKDRLSNKRLIIYIVHPGSLPIPFHGSPSLTLPISSPELALHATYPTIASRFSLVEDVGLSLRVSLSSFNPSWRISVAEMSVFDAVGFCGRKTLDKELPGRFFSKEVPSSTETRVKSSRSWRARRSTTCSSKNTTAAKLSSYPDLPMAFTRPSTASSSMPGRHPTTSAATAWLIPAISNPRRNSPASRSTPSFTRATTPKG
mmetsp:Transcript_6402/g.12788  ORF Transcript_6402/g.12788 Transcript_6402/m.12788 type:complete len:276 (+) Transcript_6402:1548-2375(+)